MVIKRTVVFLISFLAMMFLAYAGLDFVLTTAPEDSKIFLRDNPIWYQLIVGIFWLGIITVSMHNSIILSNKFNKKKEAGK